MRDQRKRFFHAIIGLASLAAALSLARPAAPGTHRPERPAQKNSKALNSCTRCLERRAVLDPNLFAQGYERDVKAAYEAARQYPDLLDRIHCFCECKESPREHHKTLLTCFTNTHAAGCGICVNEALLAARLKEQGNSDEQVETTVESLNKLDGHPPTFGRGL